MIVLERERPIGFVVLDQGVGPPCIFERARQRHVFDAGPRGGRRTCRRLERGLHRFARLRPDVHAHHTDARLRRRYAVDAQIAVRNGRRREGDVAHARRKHAGRVELPRETFHADGGQQLIGGLETRHPAEGRGPNDRAAGLAADCDRDHAGGDRRGRARGGAAGRVLHIPGIAGLGRLHVRELGGHGLAEQQPAGAADLRDQGRIGSRAVAGVDRRAVFGGEIHRIEDVLDADGKPA